MHSKEPVGGIPEKLHILFFKLSYHFSKIFSIAAHEHPAGFYGMAFNNITLTIELLNYYEKLWNKIKSTQCSSIEEARVQNGQRVIMIQKMSFIEIMSSFEFCSKKIVQERSKFGSFSGRIYLSKIMSKTKDIGLIDDTKLALWNGAVRLRNSLVHNNGISEETETYSYPDITIQVTDGKMTQGNLKLFGLLTKWVLNESKDWIITANT